MKETKANAYKIIMSRGDPIQLDAEEMPKIISAMQAGTPCKVKRGLFNPSFYVEIVEDTERLKTFRSEVHKVLDANKFDKMYHGGKQQKEIPKLKPLKNIFEGVALKIESPSGAKKLTE